jgi:hypothetical protein
LTLEAMIPPKICAVLSGRSQRHSARPGRCVIVLFSGRASSAPAHQGLSLLSTALQNPEFADDFEDNRLAAPEAKNLIPVDQD